MSNIDDTFLMANLINQDEGPHERDLQYISGCFAIGAYFSN